MMLAHAGEQELVEEELFAQRVDDEEQVLRVHEADLVDEHAHAVVLVKLRDVVGLTLVGQILLRCFRGVSIHFGANSIIRCHQN